MGDIATRWQHLQVSVPISRGCQDVTRRDRNKMVATMVVQKVHEPTPMAVGAGAPPWENPWEWGGPCGHPEAGQGISSSSKCWEAPWESLQKKDGMAPVAAWKVGEVTPSAVEARTPPGRADKKRAVPQKVGEATPVVVDAGAHPWKADEKRKAVRWWSSPPWNAYGTIRPLRFKLLITSIFGLLYFSAGPWSGHKFFNQNFFCVDKF